MTRLFIALNLPVIVKNLIAEEIGKLYSKNLFIGKITEKDNMHLTLKFLGEVEESRIPEIVERLKDIKLKKFLAELGEFGVFDKKFVRIIWVKLENCDKLQKEVDDKLKGMFSVEERFMSHVTAARVKSCEKEKLIKEIEKIKLEGKFEVESFELMSSKLSTCGPVYSVVERFKLY